MNCGFVIVKASSLVLFCLVLIRNCKGISFEFILVREEGLVIRHMVVITKTSESSSNRLVSGLNTMDISNLLEGHRSPVKVASYLLDYLLYLLI